MINSLGHYLENVKSNLRLAPSDEREILSELQTHIEDRFQELTESGLSEEEATTTCLSLRGSAKLVASRMYEAYSQGTWRHALFASFPHLLFGLVFALNWWQHIGWLSLSLVLILGITVYGWWHGKPTWVFPWLGYSMLPVFIIGLLLLYLPRGWSLLAIPLYFSLALWWVLYVLVQVIKRDWLLGSLTLLPVPIIACWFLAVAPEGEFTKDSIQRTYDLAPSIGLSFLVLAITITAFIRLRQRWLRITLLVTSGLLTLLSVMNGRLTLPTFLALIFAFWGLFLIPSLLERRVRNRPTTMLKRV